MADLALRTRDQPDIRARISIHDDESPNDIKELLIADQTQRALRSKQSWTPPEALGSLHRAVLRKTRTLPYPYRPGHFHDVPASDPLPCPLNRSNSLNSLSTIQRETEAASLSLYRGSPISAISPPCAPPSASLWTPDVDYELQDPCPPRPTLRVETLSQQRKQQKHLKKLMKKEEKEQRKAQKEEDELRRQTLAAEVARSRKWAAGDSISLRSKSTRSIASQVVKSLSLKTPLNKLSRHVRRDRSDPPTLDDFDSKQQLRDYLNPSPPPPPSEQIAELPAELPEYTPFQDSTRSEKNEPVALLEDPRALKENNDLSPLEDDDARANDAPPSPRSMRCDSCKSPIRLQQVYYHCSICDHGDRILCSSCDQAGWSCRHNLTERVRSVSRPAASQKVDVASMSGEQTRSEAQQYATAMWGVNLSDYPAHHKGLTESPAQATLSADSPWAYHDILEQKKSHEAQQRSIRQSQRALDAKELDFRQRERDMVFREKEVTLREREAAMREQQASIREQEAALHVKQQMFALQVQSAVARQMSVLSTGVGAQFQDLSQNDKIRAHATKRKAGTGSATVSPSNSTGSNRKYSPKRTPNGGQDPDEDDEDATGGTPKKIKQDPDSVATPGKLFACPFCRFDKSRYSEQNTQEKHYRGCSSGYWPDISRLKQHLYRVHWRRIHCVRCYTNFKNKDELDQHVRGAAPCAFVECPFPEKFNEAQYNEIRRKRPASTPEQVWYTIFGILFPGMTPPTSPYADNTGGPSALSPGADETQGTMDVLGEVFESRLNQLTNVPGQGWLQSAEARQLIREQLRASMADVLQRLGHVNSPPLGNPSFEVSPGSAQPMGSARRSSISPLTPTSSLPPSPVHGSGSTSKTGDGSHFPLRSRPQSFSRPRPVPARPAPQTPSQPVETAQILEESPSEVTFPDPLDFYLEDDQYGNDCISWGPDDDHVLDITTDTMLPPLDLFEFDFTSEFEKLNKMPGIAEPLPPSKFNPVKLSSLNEPSAEASTRASELKPKHSTASSVDSGYGSLGHASSSASASSWACPGTQTKSDSTPKARKNKGKRKAPEFPKEPSPVPESSVNFQALDESFQDFSGANLNLNLEDFMDEFDFGTGIGVENMGTTDPSGGLDMSNYCEF
ncbi:uncharacterized protein Z520_10696 [Fonsecaea multimorphosa CBS 102226]|uniref:C2H2-type domain-containing protein n=1 Tax=Fonsecaea multimorphosa CBS 102226 TaxID=1442371 RepID=A0A0D2KAM7_9EURO|nr:uncharacterized protein Z520_10696 [Fonsecaea multimorphosa CBS 102226]KIX93518.1 hypothetical protein Z520_10696 [Fonsecaea multimorphosa CBS 102226]OAL18833.1 hypothetical protein AYO22_10162 [Fonsecaea multimorphosa]